MQISYTSTRLHVLLCLITAVMVTATSVDQGPYVSEYNYHCPTAAMTAAAGRTACQSFGGGWDIATLPTVASQNAIVAMTPSPTVFSAWVGITDAAQEGTWLNMAGRLANRVYYVGVAGGPCSTIDYNPYNLPGRSTIFNSCWWNTGEPNNAATENSPYENCASTVFPTSGLINDYECTQKSPCVICERSPCKFDVDCHPLNSVSMMSGAYFPSCVCVCKPGYYGTHCEKQAIVDQGPYVSIYHYVCPAIPMTVAQGSATCQSLGVGWDLATIPTPQAQTVFNKIIPQTLMPAFIGWLGLTDKGHEGIWQYTTGRLAGLNYSLGSNCSTSSYDPFGLGGYSFNFCKWFPGEPNNANTTYSPTEDCAAIWDIENGTINDYECNQPAACTACERSPCKYEVDCHPHNSLGMNGTFYPNCTCVCKPSYYGTRCDHQMTVDQGPYFSQYHYYCPATGGLTLSGAFSACRSLGTGWDLGTIPTLAAQQAVKTLIPYVINPAVLNSWYAWVALTDEPVEGTWRWTAGRLKNDIYSLNEVCAATTFDPFGLNSTVFDECWWFTGEPNNQGPENCAMVPHLNGGLNDYPCDSTGPPLSCALCERSMCEFGIDCHPLNTASMSGNYYPNCTCACKPSYWGPRCEKQTVVDQGPYISEYEIACSGDALSWSDARATCQSLGGIGWDIATFPTVAAFNTISERNYSLRTWIGATDVDAEGTWKWAGGRLAKRDFFRADTGLCETIFLDPFSKKPIIFRQQCPWAAGEPDNGAGAGENCATASSGAISDTNCDQPQQCYACERSKCKLGTDCHPTNTLTMVGVYFPSCQCVCKPGVGGDRCQYPYVSPTLTHASSQSIGTTSTVDAIASSSLSPAIAISETTFDNQTNTGANSPSDSMQPTISLNATKTLYVEATSTHGNTASLNRQRTPSLDATSSNNRNNATASSEPTLTIVVGSPTSVLSLSISPQPSSPISISLSLPMSKNLSLSSSVNQTRTVLAVPSDSVGNSNKSSLSSIPTSSLEISRTGALDRTAQEGPKSRTITIQRGLPTTSSTAATQPTTTNATLATPTTSSNSAGNVTSTSLATNSTTPLLTSTSSSVASSQVESSIDTSQYTTQTSSTTANTETADSSSSVPANTNSSNATNSTSMFTGATSGTPTREDGTNTSMATVVTTKLLPTTSAGPPNTTETSSASTIPTTSYPEPLIYNAPDTDATIGDPLRFAAAPNAILSLSKSSAYHCRRLETVLTQYAILAPFPDTVTSYSGAIGINAIVFVGSVLLGVLTVALHGLYRKIFSEEPQRRKRFAPASTLSAAVRFPGTAIQMMIILSHGTAVAAGLSLGEGTGIAAAVVAVIVMALATVGWALAAALAFPVRVIITSPPPKVQQGTVLLCTGARPLHAAKLLGPIVADLKHQGRAAPVIPMALPFLLFIVSIIVSSTGECQFTPLVIGILFFGYAICVAMLQPFLGIAHNAVESLVSAIAACILISFFAHSQQNENGSVNLTSGESASLLVFVAVSNCRLPFALARALDVGLPKIGSVLNSGAGSALADDKNFSFVHVNEDDEDDEFVGGGREVAYNAARRERSKPFYEDEDDDFEAF